MKQIPLTRGYSVLVDNKDFKALNKVKWYASVMNGVVYAAHSRRENGKTKTILMHRQILDVGPGIQVDHKDGDGTNNQRSNLRPATCSQNHYNQRIARDNTSGYKGVYVTKNGARWVAGITYHHRHIHIGTFPNPIEAAITYNQKARELFGDFARLNVIPHEVKP